MLQISLLKIGLKQWKQRTRMRFSATPLQGELLHLSSSTWAPTQFWLCVHHAI